MLPRILHQVWLGPAPLPDEFRGYRETWLRHHPGWELRFWTEENLPPDLVRPEVHERLRQPAERADLLRLEVLLREGGVYLDTDFECLRPIEPLLEGVECFCAYLKPGRVNNAILGATPGHPFLERVLREARPRTEWGYDKDAAGPFLLDRLVKDEPGVTIFPPELFYPRTEEERRQAYAIHHAARGWKSRELLMKDVLRAEERQREAQDELQTLRRRYDAALEEIASLRSGSRLGALRARLARLRP